MKPVLSRKLLVFSIVLILITASLGALFSQITRGFIVSKDGNGAYTSIQKAIDEASAGDTIYVKKGIYNEQLTINKNIVLMGEDRLGVVLQGKGGNESKNLTYNGIYVNAENVKIDGFNITGFGNGIYIARNRAEVTNCMISSAARGISSFGSDIRISNNFLTRISGYGIDASNGKNVEITDNIVTNSTSAYGIYLFNSDNVIVANNTLSRGDSGVYSVSSNATIIGNNIINNTNPGVFNLMSTNTILRNNILGNGDGVVLRASTKCKVSGNAISSVFHGIIFLSMSKVDYTNTENTIAGNVIYSSMVGIRLYGSNENNVIEGNLIEKSSVVGILLQGIYDSYQYYCINSNNKITKNIITDNNKGMMVIGANPDTNEIKNNNIYKNTEYGIDAINPQVVVPIASEYGADAITEESKANIKLTAKENYWGASNGPYSPLNPFGEGDAVTVNVNFLSWLKSEEKIDKPTAPNTTTSNYPLTRDFPYGTSPVAAFVSIVAIGVCAIAVMLILTNLPGIIRIVRKNGKRKSPRS